jgi:hypothetical protein
MKVTSEIVSKALFLACGLRIHSIFKGTFVQISIVRRLFFVFVLALGFLLPSTYALAQAPASDAASAQVGVTTARCRDPRQSGSGGKPIRS